MTRLLVAALILLAVGALAVALLARRPARDRVPPATRPAPTLPEAWRRSEKRARDFWFGIALLLAVIAAGLLVESLG